MFRLKVSILVLAFSLVLPAGSFAGDFDSTPHLKRAQEMSLLGKWPEAVEAFQQALKEQPDNNWIQANLGVALSRSERNMEALLAFEKALQMGYDNAEFRYLRGLTFAKVNLLADAAKEIELALEMDSQLKFADYDLGLIYEHMGAHDKALAQVTKLYRRNNTLARKLYFELTPEYKIAAVDDGGSLKGKVRMNGSIPKPRVFHLINIPNIKYCSRISDGQGHRILHDFVVNDTGALKDTVIAILNVEKGKPFPRKMTNVTISRCQADQYVIGFKNGEDLLLENTDPIKHEMALYEVNGVYKYQVSNKNTMPHSSQVRSLFMKPGAPELILKCNLHPFIQTRGLMVANPYYAVTDAEGNFEIHDIPPGTYEVMAWHPFIPSQTGTITIEKGKTAKLDFTFEGEEERRKLYQNDTKGYRFNTVFENEEGFYGGKREMDPVEVLQQFNNTDRYIDVGDSPTEE
ncbi:MULTISPECIES: tetratricopeptide repeat protein [unclassified Nitrospina]|uniref:tetratricopeptide repeat protein n=1 Tax=unclassified Nitrospina TaxID=2638683 RepID=UPI003F9C9BD9